MLLQNDEDRMRLITVRRVKRFGILAASIAALVVANGVFVRLNARNEEQRWTTEHAIPTVTIVHPKPGAEGSALTLPGTLQAYYAAPLYARVPGYVKSWNKDIGSRVKRGDVLAEIDAPELDQQVAQAQADLANADAAHKQSENTAGRWTNLLKIGAVSKQDAEEKTSDLAVKNAVVKSAKANLDRLLAMKTFARIVAPFDGVVTERTVDIGNLVNAGSGSAGPALFTVADTHKMRVYVRVPQNYSAQIIGGLKAKLSLPEYPGVTFDAKLVSTSNAISNQSNTLLVQLEADNPEGKLKAGGYAQVSFQLPAGAENLSIPVSALLFRADGLRVAAIDEQQRAVLKAITIANDFGTTVEVNSGLATSDQIINNPPDSLQSGDAVRVAESATMAVR